MDRNHFPLLSRQVSEWLSDVPQAHSRECRDKRAASTWDSISFRAAVQSLPTLHPHSQLRFGGRKTDQHVNRGWGVPGNPAPRARQRPQAGASVPRPGAGAWDCPGPEGPGTQAFSRLPRALRATGLPAPAPAPHGPTRRAYPQPPAHLRAPPPCPPLPLAPAGSVRGPRLAGAGRACEAARPTAAGERGPGSRGGCSGRGRVAASGPGTGPCRAGGASSPWSRSAAGVSRPPPGRPGPPALGPTPAPGPRSVSPAPARTPRRRRPSSPPPFGRAE